MSKKKLNYFINIDGGIANYYNVHDNKCVSYLGSNQELLTEARRMVTAVRLVRPDFICRITCPSLCIDIVSKTVDKHHDITTKPAKRSDNVHYVPDEMVTYMLSKKDFLRDRLMELSAKLHDKVIDADEFVRCYTIAKSMTRGMR